MLNTLHYHLCILSIFTEEGNETMFLTTKQIDVTGKAWSYVSVLVKPRRCNAIYDCQSLLRGHWTMIRKVQQHNDTLLLIDSKNIRRPLNQAGKKLFTNWETGFSLCSHLVWWSGADV